MGKMKELFMELHQFEDDFADADYLYEEWKEHQVIEKAMWEAEARKEEEVVAFLTLQGKENKIIEKISNDGKKNV
jgi:hypothetical protein